MNIVDKPQFARAAERRRFQLVKCEGQWCLVYLKGESIMNTLRFRRGTEPEIPQLLRDYPEAAGSILAALASGEETT